MREIVLDTETTGFDPSDGDRLVEIGCVEIWDKMPTGQQFHCFINPLREMSDGAREVTGYDDAFLAQFEPFDVHVQGFLDFIADDPLVIHNASFDLKFLNHELSLLGLTPLATSRSIDTLELARRLYPGQRNSLDALCQRLGIDAAARDKHGALIDAELLAQVYLEMSGGRQKAFQLPVQSPAAEPALDPPKRIPRAARVFTLPVETRAAHLDFLKQSFSADQNPIWADYKSLNR